MSELDDVINKLASTTVEEEKIVSFEGQSLTLDSEEDAEKVVEAIKNCPGMTTLCLEGNTIGVPAAKAIAKALESQPNFRRALWKDMFTRRKEWEIFEALSFLSSGITLANAHLVELDLSDNAFGPRGLRGIVNLLKSAQCYTLKVLMFNNNGLGVSGAQILAQALCQLLENSRKDSQPLKLEKFVCGRNRLENEGSLAISEFLRSAETLKHIALPQNGIYYKGIEGLSKAFAANVELKVLNLNDNSITAKGSGYLAEAIPHLKNIEVINFGDCLLRTEGSRLIANSLKGNCPKLRELLLEYNEIKKEGIPDIINAIEDKTSLEKLILNGNQFGTDGCKFVKGLIEKVNKSLLGSLSDDESPDEDSEEEDDDDDSSATEEDAEYANEHNGDLDSNAVKVAMFSDFINNPSAKVLQQLYESKADILTEIPKESTLKDHLDLFLKMSDLLGSKDDDLEKVVAHYSDQVLSAAFGMYSEEEMWRFNNDFMVITQLIKGEEKFVGKRDITGVLLSLKHIIWNNYFQNSTRNLIKLVLSRPLRYTTADPDAISALLKKLY